MTDSTADDSPFFTSAQLAKHLKSSDDLLYKWRREGGGPPFICVCSEPSRARRFLYPKDGVANWLSKRLVSILPPKRRRRSKHSR